MQIPLLQTPQVRDLAWAVFSQPIVHFANIELAGALADRHAEHQATNCEMPLNAQRCEWLCSLDRRPQPLLDFLAGQHGTRLGIYFEWLWRFFLEQDDRIELLAHNLAVREHGRTLGEFDIIYRRQGENVVRHLELAVKFYLQSESVIHSPLPGFSSWLGPGAKDRLDLKISRLLDHQIALSCTPAGRDVLAAITRDRVIREIEVKGYLFGKARHHSEPSVPPPIQQQPESAPGLRQPPPRQIWTTQDDLLKAVDPGLSNCFIVLDRHRWIGPALESDSPQKSLNIEQLQSQLAATLEHNLRPRLIVHLDQEGAEQSRFFAVPRGWPRSVIETQPAQSQS